MTLRFLVFRIVRIMVVCILVPKLLVLDAMRLPEHGDTRPQHCHSKHRFAVLNDKPFEDVVHMACDLYEPKEVFSLLMISCWN